MSKNKNECTGANKNQDVETYIKEITGVTADMHRFVHKIRKIKSSLLGHSQRPSVGR